LKAAKPTPIKELLILPEPGMSGISVGSTNSATLFPACQARCVPLQ
jgi:hypothetical protein